MKFVRHDQLLGEDSLALALLRGDERLDGLLTHAPGDPDALFASARVAAERTLDRVALVAAINAGLDELDAPDGARESAARLADDGVVVVIAGQQPGLFGGPLLVLSKALAAVAMARRLEASGQPAVPLFWSATEDHDQAEADHVTVADGDELRRLQLALPHDGRMLSDVAIPEDIDELVAQLRALLPETPDGERVSSLCAPRASESFGTWTTRMMQDVLGALGVVVVEPRSLRELGAAVVAHELENRRRFASSVRRAIDVVTRAGYFPPLSLRRDDLFFEVVDGVRSAPGDDAAARFSERSDAISWNVVTRVLAQNLVLPVAAHVCGPSELAYVALFREAHELLEIPQPLAVLRPGVTPVEPRITRACRDLGVAVEDVVVHGEAAVLAEVVATTSKTMQLREALEALPGTSPAAARRRRELLRQIDLYAEAYGREVRDRDAAVVTRRARVLAALRPGGVPAERVLGFLPLLARHGDALLHAMASAFESADAEHVVLFTAEDL